MGGSGVQSCLCGSDLNPASTLTSLGLRFLCAPKAGSWLGVCLGSEGVGVEIVTGNKHLCTVTTNTHSHTHTQAPLHGHPTLHNHSPDIHPPRLLCQELMGLVGAEDRPKTQPVSFLLYETWAVHPHCMSHQESLSGLTKKGHSVLYPRDITPCNPSPPLRTPISVQLRLLLCGSPLTLACGTSTALHTPSPTFCSTGGS